MDSNNYFILGIELTFNVCLKIVICDVGLPPAAECISSSNWRKKKDNG